MRAGSRRALLAGLSVLLPAAGIAYLGAVSYRDDRGIVAARLDEQNRAAREVAGSVAREIDAALDAVSRSSPPAVAPPAGATASRHPLAHRPFRIARTGRLIYPSEHPLRAPGADPEVAERFLGRVPRVCPERGFESCVAAMRAARRRQSQLLEARRREAACAGERPCRPGDRGLAEAARLYGALVRFDDTGPAAALGLARLSAMTGRREEAAARYRMLGERFGGRADEDGIPYALLAELGAAEVAGGATGHLALYRRLIDRGFRAPAPILQLAAKRLRAGLGEQPLDRAQRAELAGLDARLAAATAEARAAAALAPRVEEVARSAGAETRGLPLGSGGDTLVFRREAGGDVVGLIVGVPQLVAAAGRADVDLASLADGARASVVAIGDTHRDSGTRTLASAGFGPTLPHLSLELVNDASQPDPLDEIVRQRGRRHLAITGGLAALLVIGLWATIRGAARERELARLKSDFVSTVSHELKTPLTSIRMFGEMLQQGVAGSDRDREGRYHQVIVKESERLGLLIANLLDYSQIEKGTRRYQQQPVAAAELAEESVATFDRLRETQQPPVVLRVEPAAADAAVTVDREVVVGALLNLLGNAAKYGGERGPIEVTVGARDAGRVVLAVRDHGPGIPKTEHGRIFKEFYRTAEAYRSGIEGTGLGLALVKRHVEAQGGEVEVDSAVGRGATFSLMFPRSA